MNTIANPSYISAVIPTPEDAQTLEGTMPLSHRKQVEDIWRRCIAENILLGIQEGTFNGREGGRILLVPENKQDPIHSALRICPGDPIVELHFIKEVLHASNWELVSYKENRGEEPFRLRDNSTIFGYDFHIKPLS